MSVWWIWDFLVLTDVTGELHRPDRCRGLLWKFSDFPAETGLTGATHHPDRFGPVVPDLLVLLRS
jgi:hypothetical protein